MSQTVRQVAENGRVTVPKHLRDEYGDTYEFEDTGDGIKMIPLARATGE